MSSLVIGIDIGTSGVRAVALDEAGALVHEAHAALPAPERVGQRVTQSPALWWTALERTLDQLLAGLDGGRVVALAVDGTSGTLLLTDELGEPLTEGWMYNEASCVEEALRVAACAPADSSARGISSALARLLHLQGAQPLARHALHQADWVAGRLAGRFGVADENNVLKLGYDLLQRRWPDWLDQLGVRRELLPEVVVPGTPLGCIAPVWARRFGLGDEVIVAAGTTDGVAAFLATGAAEVGDAVTSLGSTLVVKLLSDRPICDPRFGVYSHRLGELWLAGGASNSGGAALLRFFTREQMESLTPLLDPDLPTGLGYYPLPAPGERFPLNDPGLAGMVEPRPREDARFFQGLLEGIAAIEKQAFERLGELGAPALRRVYSVGGGAGNRAWTRIRQRALGVPMLTPALQQAAVGAARLARQGWLATAMEAA